MFSCDSLICVHVWYVFQWFSCVFMCGVFFCCFHVCSCVDMRGVCFSMIVLCVFMCGVFFCCFQEAKTKQNILFFWGGSNLLQIRPQHLLHFSPPPPPKKKRQMMLQMGGFKFVKHVPSTCYFPPPPAMYQILTVTMVYIEKTLL